jgi:hypothetical protein
MSAASKIAAPATTAPTVATVPTALGPKIPLGSHLLARVKDVIKEDSPSSMVADDTRGARVPPSSDGGMTTRVAA